MELSEQSDASSDGINEIDRIRMKLSHIDWLESLLDETDSNRSDRLD